MRWTKTFIPTLKETPAEAEAPSHKLMLRAAMIRKLASGTYSYLPLGARVLRKVERIVREEMDKAGAVEVLLPAVQPAELWRESGRWDLYGPNLITFRDRHGHVNVMGPTHEEVVTALVRGELRSWRQMPLVLYQIQAKFRDEVRPRFGVLRSREFIMKDAYSFDRDVESMDASYRKMYEAYCRIFARCGLRYAVVEAESGPIGGDASHEFMVPAPSGEDLIVSCGKCGYAANIEKAECHRPPGGPAGPGSGSPKAVETPGMKTIGQLSAFLRVSPERLVKTMICASGGEVFAVLLRGDHELNESKLAKLSESPVGLADAAAIARATGAPVGFAGPVGLKLKIYADYAVERMADFVVGANEADRHLVDVNCGRDFEVAEYRDLRKIVDGDGCPRCEGVLGITRGIEVGHVFKLGEKYSKLLGATYVDEDGAEKPFVMGCYGIGVNRILAAAVEGSRDEKGIIWPAAIAPYEAAVLPMASAKDPATGQAAERLYGDLIRAGVDAILDDRDVSAGVKFNDADLIGFPLRVVVGKQGLSKGAFEVRRRAGGEVSMLPIETAAASIAGMIEEMRRI